MEQRLVSLKPSGIVKTLNAELRENENSNLGQDCVRPSRRRGVFLADDEFGLLITDMTATDPSAGTLEFKPKWLLQSPTAPKGAVRCRTCARIARLNAINARNRLSAYDTFCPLDLLSTDPKILDKVARQLLAQTATPSRVSHVTRWLRSNSLLPKLKRLQAELDPKGVLIEPHHDDLKIAMTLRDCTVYLRFNQNDGNRHDKLQQLEADARLGDLDLKSSAKVTYWLTMERNLINEGWYTGNEKESDRQPLTCALSRK